MYTPHAFPAPRTAAFGETTMHGLMDRTRMAGPMNVSDLALATLDPHRRWPVGGLPDLSGVQRLLSRAVRAVARHLHAGTPGHPRPAS
ncbi:MAG: hypothetical protein KDE22_09015 [Rhodobacterales bacterium]|nr:hypothetical protein [Rhodobacterales bacterium]